MALGSCRTSRENGAPRCEPPRETEKIMNRLRTILLLGVLTAVLIGIGSALGPGYLYGFTALALIINFGSYFFSDRIVLAMRGRGARTVAR